MSPIAWESTRMQSRSPSLHLMGLEIGSLPQLTRSHTRWHSTQRSAIYASLADSMVASVIAEHSKLLREKLAIIQEAQVAAVSAGFVAASNLQLLRRDALLQNFGIQPQVHSTVRTAPFERSHVLGPEPKVFQQQVRTIRQADRMAGSSVTFIQKTKDSLPVQSSTKKTASSKTTHQARASVFEKFSEGSYYHSENNHPGPVLSCQSRQGRLLVSRSSTAQEV